MNKRIFDSPWPHMVIDDIFDTETMLYIVKNIEDESYWNDRCAKVKPVINQSTKEHTAGINFCDIKDLRIGSILENRWRQIDIFNSLIPSDRRHDGGLKHSWDVKFTKQPTCFDIHEEGAAKVATMTIFIHPLHDNGTFLFDADKNFSKAVAWKPNRACVMSNRKNYFHAYGGYEGHTRITINSFLMRNEEDILLDTKS